jgi:hypothetical protein
MSNLDFKSEQFSLFYDHLKGIFNTQPKKEINLHDLIKIYNSNHVKDITSAIQLATTKSEKGELKKKLPFITPYGTFSKRNNDSILTFNNKLVAFDFDGLTEDSAQELKRKASKNNSVVLAVISPRQKGVKILVRIASETKQTTLYDTLKLNCESICIALGIREYYNYSDKAQFVLSQPLFIAYDPNIYFNPKASALNIELKEYKAPEVPKIELTKTPPLASNRIEAYILRASNKLANDLQSKQEGERHHSIKKVSSVASWLHYAPRIKEDVKSLLLEVVISMYGGERNAQRNNAIKSFKQAFDDAPMKANATIERIINEVKNRQNLAL